MTLEFLQNDFLNKTYSSSLFQRYRVKPQLREQHSEREEQLFSGVNQSNFIRTNVRESFASVRKLQSALAEWFRSEAAGERHAPESIRVDKLAGNGMNATQMREMSFYVDIIMSNEDSRKVEPLYSVDLEL